MTRELQILLDRIVPALQPDAIYLFGSRGRGEADWGSDYDLLVVVPDGTPPERRTLRAGFDAKHGTGIAADVIPCRRSVFERRKHLAGTLSYEAWHHGLRVYER